MRVDPWLKPQLEAVHSGSRAGKLGSHRWRRVSNAGRGAVHHFTTTFVGGLGSIAFVVGAPVAPMSVPSVPAFLNGLSPARV
jgi:hypothetical protein